MPAAAIRLLDMGLPRVIMLLRMSQGLAGFLGVANDRRDGNAARK